MIKIAKTVFQLGIVSMLLGISLSAAGEEDLKVKQKASMGAEIVNEQAKSSRFFEYRDVPNGFFFDSLRLRLDKGNWYSLFSADNIRQKDAKYRIELGSYGTYKLYFDYDQIPHRFSFEGKTLFVEKAPGDYQLADQIQIANQLAVGEGGQNSNDNIGAARSLLSSFLTGAHPVDLELVRKKGTVGFSFNPWVPLSLNFKLSREERKGTRPIGASNGFSSVLELPEPIDFKTTNIDANVELSKEWGSLRLGYYTSIFENDIQAMLWDNPYRITDQTFHEPRGAYVNGNGSARSRMALDPSNSAHNLYVNGSVKVLKSTRLSGSASFGRLSQDENLLPFTINSALTPEYGSALIPPAASAMAEVNTGSFNLSLFSRITNFLNLNAGYRYYNYENKTPLLEFEEGYSRFDQVWEDEHVETHPLTYSRSRMFANVNLNLLKSMYLNIGYTYSTFTRSIPEHGEEDEHLEGGEEDENTEGTFKASLDAHLTDWMLFRISYLMAQRDWSLEGKVDLYLEGYSFRRYFQAERDRNALNILLDLAPFKNFGLTLTYLLGQDEYPQSGYGLLDYDVSSYSLDLSYSPTVSSAIYAFYTKEIFEGNQRSSRLRDYTELNDWTAFLEDNVDSLGGGINMALIKDKVHFDASYIYSKTTGTSDLFSPPGGNPDVAVNFKADLDTTTLHIFKSHLTWKLQKNLSLILGYWYEQYDIEDIIRNDVPVDFLAQGSAVFLGAVEPGYKYHVGSLKFIWSW